MEMQAKIDLSVNIGGCTLKNPVITASGTFGYGREFVDFMDIERLGAIAVKGLTMQPRPGNKPPRLVETPSGLINAIGLENVGIKKFIEVKAPYLKQLDTKIIANISGFSPEEYAGMTELLCEAEAADLIEANLSCPNIKHGGIAFGSDPKMMADITAELKRRSAVPVIVKLSPNVTDIAMMARVAEENGADAVSLVNTFLALAIDVEQRRPVLGNVTGGLSGPAIRPIAVRMTWQVAQAVSIPVMGMGGIATARDALEFLIAGACCVAPGTACFVNPAAPVEVLEGIEDYMRRHNMTRLDELIGSLSVESD
ncbi:dihydroorotate dehydrogenase [Candidatus Sumerlaeota bacterium]|nr:dihydroorotate dehydrogenase [Candidatus Sumerlaeota bacterium]